MKDVKNKKTKLADLERKLSELSWDVWLNKRAWKMILPNLERVNEFMRKHSQHKKSKK